MFNLRNKKETPPPVSDRASDYVEAIIGRGIEWFDFEKMDQGGQIMYFNDARFIVEHEVFNNELHHYISDLIKFCAYEAKDFDQVLHTRSAIVALETFRDRLKDIKNPLKEESFDDLHEAV